MNTTVRKRLEIAQEQSRIKRAQEQSEVKTDNRVKVNGCLFSRMCETDKEEAFKDFLIDTHPSCLLFQPSTLYPEYMKKIRSIKPLLINDIQTKERDENSIKTGLQKTTLYKNIIRLYRKTMSLPHDAFDEDVVIMSKEEKAFLFSKEVLSLFSEYFERTLTSGCKEGQVNEAGQHKITLDLSDSAISTLLEYFSSKKITTEDVATLVELLEFANMILKGSLQRDLLAKVIPYLIQEENREYFSRELFSCVGRSAEGNFVRQYLKHRNINIGNYTSIVEDKWSITIDDFIKLFDKEGPIEDVLSEYITGLIIGSENYSIISFYPQKYMDNIVSIKYVESYHIGCSINYQKVEADCKRIITSFSKLKNIWIPINRMRNLIEICNKDKKVPFTSAILGYAQNIKAQTSLEYLEKAASQISQNYFDTRFGTLYLDIGDFENGKKFFKKALEVTPDCAFINARLGICYLEQNKLELGEEYLKKAFEIDPQEEGVISGNKILEKMKQK